MLLQMIGSALFMPLALPLLIPGLQADPWSIAQPVLVLMILPLAIGLLIKSRFERLPGWVGPLLGRVSNVSLILLTVLLIGLNFDALLGTLGSGAVGAGALLVVLSLGVGSVLGGPAVSTKRVLGIGTAQRNIAAALVTATTNLPDPKVVVMLLMTTLGGLAVLLTAAVLFRRSRAYADWPPSPSVGGNPQ
jgi:BASS family bile acid:Na+ symporter